MNRPSNRLLASVISAAGAAFILLMTGCVAPPVMTTKLARFPLMYEEKPTTILVLPPINHTTAADAKDYYATTVAAPLSFRGFYVLPMEVTSDILKSQGIYDTETIQRQPTAKFKQYFGADAVLYTEINRWSTTYAVLSASLTVGFHATLKSTLTERVLWEYSGTLVIDLTGHSNSGNLIADLIVGAVATSIAAAATDYVPYATQANTRILYTIPVGKYHEEHMIDQEIEFVDQGALPSSPQATAAPQSQAASSPAPVPVVTAQASPSPVPVVPAQASSAPVPLVPAQTSPAAEPVPVPVPESASVPQPTGPVPASNPEAQVTPVKLKNGLGLAVTAEGGRLLVTGVLPDSAAAEAGIQRDDQILKYNGMPDGSLDSTQLPTIASAINSPLQHKASITWRTNSGVEKTQTLDW